MPWSEGPDNPFTTAPTAPSAGLDTGYQGLDWTSVTASKPLVDVWRGPQPPRLVNLIWGRRCQLAVNRRIFAAEPVH